MPIVALLVKGKVGHAVLAVGIGLAVWGVALALAGRRARVRERAQGALLAEAGPNYAAPVRWRGTSAATQGVDELTPDVAGVLIADPEAYTLVTREGGLRRAHRLERARTQVRWVGRSSSAPLGASWIALDMDARRLLVTAETGTLPFGSRQATRSIYEHLVERSASPAAAG